MLRGILWSSSLMIASAVAGADTAAEDSFVQKQAQFRAALENGSTSPSFVFVTIIDGRSGKRRSGCTLAGFLLRVIAKNEGVERIDFHGTMLPDAMELVTAKALASKDHVYTFYNAEALAAVLVDLRGFDRACAIIRSGLPAYMQDRSGQILTGQPMKTDR